MKATMKKETSQALSISEEKEPQRQLRPRKHFKNKMHLWEFILELLHDNDHSMITWTNKERGEFKIVDTEKVASLWGREHGRRGMTYDKLSRALRQYYNEGIVRKVKGQRTTYRFVNLPYEYHPGITRRRRTAPRERRISTYPHGMEHGDYIDDPEWRATVLWSSLHGGRNTAVDSSNLPFWSSFYPDSPEEANLTNAADHGIRSGDHVTVHPPSSFQPSCPQTTTRIWFPDESRAKCSQERRNANNWALSTSVVPKTSDSISPLQALKQAVSRNVTLSDSTYSGIFLTPESSRSSSPLGVIKQIGSRNATPSPTNHGRSIAWVTPESYKSCNSSSSLHMAEPTVSRNVTPTGMECAPVRVSNGVVWPSPAYPPVSTVPYLPFMYVVPVPYERYPVITGVTGNYHRHYDRS